MGCLYANVANECTLIRKKTTTTRNKQTKERTKKCVSWYSRNQCWLAFVLWVLFTEFSFFLMRHLVIQINTVCAKKQQCYNVNMWNVRICFPPQPRIVMAQSLKRCTYEKKIYSTEGALTKGVLGHAPPVNFQNLGSLNCHLLRFPQEIFSK